LKYHLKLRRPKRNGIPLLLDFRGSGRRVLRDRVRPDEWVGDGRARARSLRFMFGLFTRTAYVWLSPRRPIVGHTEGRLGGGHHPPPSLSWVVSPRHFECDIAAWNMSLSSANKEKTLINGYLKKQ